MTEKRELRDVPQILSQVPFQDTESAFRFVE